MLDKKAQYEVAIAALLHDIGKFKQRAYKGDEKMLDSSISAMEGYIAKLNSKTQLYTHRHALWTYDFFLSDLKPLVDEINFDLNLNWEKIYISSATHHNPSKDNYSQIICDADIISSSNDRENSYESYKNGDYYKKPLRSIFSNINIEEETLPKKSSYYYNLSSSTKNSYPIENSDSDINLNYLELWKSFVSELKNIPKKINLNEFLMKLKDLIYQFTWCIPSATNDIYNDISLYDHSVTTMVFSLAIANSKNENKFRIFAADISGIQQYIFQSKYSSFKGAAKIFRGRSFIISSISNAYRIALCEKLDIIPFVDLIDAGGKFTIILPSDDALISKIDDFVKDQDYYFLKKYQGTLCVLSDYSLEVNNNAFSKENFVETQKNIGYLLNSKKTRKFENCIRDIGFVINDMDITGKRCNICGKNNVVNEEVDFCFQCEAIQRIGSNLLKRKYINYNKYEGYEIVKGVFISIENEIYEDNYLSYCLSYSEKYPLWRLNTYSPDKTFEEIAETSISEEGKGEKFLAYVKIDVDNLGEIFIGGFPKEIYSISRYVTLSRLLNYFFNVRIKNILERDYCDAYTVISGGDDIFIILPWNQAIDFIKDIKLKFRLFCCNNSQIHFSTGIVIGHSKEPFALLNAKANYQLDDIAKETEGKNCTSYFNVVFSDFELKTFSEDVNILKKYIDEDFVSSSFIYRIYKYVNDLLSKDDRKKWAVYSKLRYDLVRNIKVEKEDLKSEIYAFFLNHIDNYSDCNELNRFKVALIHTMYELRTN